ncbi:MAG: GTPase HflX [Planctomycetota bacterium]|nr:GTPase HflX [Planctomycetota bacterium]
MTVSPADRHLEADREEEMRSLLKTAGCEVVGVAKQHLQKPVGSTYIGTGKLEEVRQLCEAGGAEEVVFDAELTPSQERNIEKHVCCSVVDYTALILHIFAANARTHQAKLAVELAQLEHNRSRLKRLWSHLDRIKAGMNMRGPGEKQLEVDRRLVDQRIQDLKAKLRDIEHRKERTIASRRDVFKVCLVGYTNAGKSTTMNALTDANVLAEDKLFATLDTRTSRLEIDPTRTMVISDTVGFIRKLPHKLVASFHATLAEVIEADLLLHVVDASLPTMEEQIEAVEEVLEHIEAQNVPTIMVFNKIDKPHSKTIVLAFQRRYRGSVGISATTGDGLDDLRQTVIAAAHAQVKRIQLRIGIADGATAAFVRSRATVLEEDYLEDAALLTIEADDRLRSELASNQAIEILPDPDNQVDFKF